MNAMRKLRVFAALPASAAAAAAGESKGVILRMDVTRKNMYGEV